MADKVDKGASTSKPDTSAAAAVMALEEAYGPGIFVSAVSCVQVVVIAISENPLPYVPSYIVVQCTCDSQLSETHEHVRERSR